MHMELMVLLPPDSGWEYRLLLEKIVIDVRGRSIDFRLYVITDRKLCYPRPLYDVVHDLLDVGVPAIQLREKDLTDVAFSTLAKSIGELCGNYSAQLFINSRLMVSAELGSHGVHLPGDSRPIPELKMQLGDHVLIGCSVHSLDEAICREKEGADFVTYSPVYATLTKPGYGPARGLESLSEVVRKVSLPVFALGGISPGRVSACIRTGAHGVAVMSGVMSSETCIHQGKAYLRELDNIGGQ